MTLDANVDVDVDVDVDAARRARLRARLGLESDAPASDAGEGDAGVDALEAGEEEEDATTQRALVERRLRKMKALRKMYRDQYWRLLDALRTKHRRFEVRRGHAGSRDAEEKANARREAAGEAAACGEDGCDERPMPCAKFCFRHILKDETQILYVAGSDGAPRMRES